MGVCRITVLDNFSCRISVILNSKCGLLRYSPNLRDAVFLRGILDGIKNYLPSLFQFLVGYSY